MVEKQYQDHLQPGSVLDGRYEVMDVLGEGGFATVYRARQLNIQRTVAIKVLAAGSDHRSRAAFEERFLREARTAAQINHPNVVTIYDFGFTQAPRRPYIAMELLTGHDLEEELTQHGPMEATRALPLFLESLEALAEAHRRGIIHKDLKPSNLFLVGPGSRRESLKIVDFGIARIHDGQEGSEGRRLTNTGQILGTPQYLAPEYIQNQTATPAVDVYQMGLILVEMLTGQAVVDSDNPYQCLMIHGSGKLELPQGLLGGQLGPVLLKALSFQHQERFPDAEAFRAALERVDPSLIGAPPPRRERRLTDTSGNLRTVASEDAPSSTGSFSQRQSGSYAPSSASAPVPVMAGAGLVDPMGSTLDALPDVSSSRPLPPAPSSPRLAPAIQPPPLRSPAPTPARISVLIGATAGLILLLLLSLGVVGYLMFQDDAVQPPLAKASLNPQDKPAPTQDQAPPTAAQPTEAAPEALAAQAPATQEPPADPEPPAPTPVDIQVEVSPATASIFQGDQELGQGTATLHFEDADAQPSSLRITAAGYEDQELEVSPSGDPKLTLSLQRASRKGHTRTSKVSKVARAPKEDTPKAASVKQEPIKQATPKDATPKATPPTKKTPSMGFVE